MKIYAAVLAFLPASLWAQAQAKTHLEIGLGCASVGAPDYKGFNAHFCKELWTKLSPLTKPDTFGKNKKGKTVRFIGNWKVLTALVTRPTDKKIVVTVQVFHDTSGLAPFVELMSSDPVAQADKFAVKVIDQIAEELAGTSQGPLL